MIISLNPITWLKIQALNSALNSLSEEHIADLIEDFGKREFGKEHKKYIELIRMKMASIIVALGKKL